MYIGNVNQKSFATMINVFELAGVFFSLLLAFGLQFWMQELPCPLCLLQRLGLLLMAFGLLMNLRFGMRPSHYGMVMLGAVYTSFVALRQIALHVVPGTGSYGSALFGLHLYTWSFIMAVFILVATIIIMSLDKQYHSEFKQKASVTRLMHICFAVMVFLIITNIVSVILECGWRECPDNPVKYLLLQAT